jgi:predicted transcriptional regulator
MTIGDIKDTLGAKLIVGEEWMSREVHTACGSDMMSDVLAFMKDQSVLLTGLCNLQVIRTAEMMDIVCIVFVRGKMPDGAMIEMAKQKEIALLSTGHRMFSACGMLYEKGLRGGAPYR